MVVIIQYFRYGKIMENVTAAVPERPNNKEKKVFEREVIMGCEMVLDISATHSRIFYTFAP